MSVSISPANEGKHLVLVTFLFPRQNTTTKATHRKGFIWSLQFQRDESMTITVRKHGSRQAWRLKLKAESWGFASQEGKQESGRGDSKWPKLSALKPGPQWYPSSDMATPSKPTQMGLLARIRYSNVQTYRRHLIQSATSLTKSKSCCRRTWLKFQWINSLEAACQWCRKASMSLPGCRWGLRKGLLCRGLLLAVWKTCRLFSQNKNFKHIK